MCRSSLTSDRLPMLIPQNPHHGPRCRDPIRRPAPFAIDVMVRTALSTARKPAAACSSSSGSAWGR